MEKMYLSALGRDVQIGSFYNYHLSCSITDKAIEEKGLTIVETDASKKLTYALLTNWSEGYKLRKLGLDSHIRFGYITDERSLTKELWYDNFLRAEKLALLNECINKSVHSSLYVRLIAVEKQVSDQTIEKMTRNGHLGCSATHVVQSVVYGAEFVCLIRKDIGTDYDGSIESCRRDLEFNLKQFMDRMIRNGSEKVGVDENQLDDVTLTLFSNLESGVVGEDMSFEKFRDRLREVIDRCARNSETEVKPYDWKPIRFSLKKIPDQMVQRLAMETNDRNKEIVASLQLLIGKSQCTFKAAESFIRKFPKMEKFVKQFETLLLDIERQWSGRLDNPTAQNVVDKRTDVSESSDEYGAIDDLLSDLMDWLTERAREFDIMAKILGDTKLPVCSREQSESDKRSNDNNKEGAMHFVMKAKYVIDPIIKRMKKASSSSITFASGEHRKVEDESLEEQRLLFDVFHVDRKRIAASAEALRDFERVAGDNVVMQPCIGEYQNREEINYRYIKLVSSDCSMNDCTVYTIGDSKYVVGRKNKTYTENENVDNATPPTGARCSECGDEKAQSISSVASDHGNRISHHSDTNNENPEDKAKKTPITLATFSETSDTRICAAYAPSGTISNNGPPAVYTLKVSKKELDRSSTRWFKIVPPVDVSTSTNKSTKMNGHVQHKMIILMGATGSGKSTLINGMVNYILGVQWEDPYRFSVIQPESEISARQSESQTKTVTAYTLHHQDGMAVPYSVTIVDTPGYGDTSGVDKDKVITRNIQDFLSNRFHPIDQVHAVCLVAASSEARLTTTQKYILDSVLSSFGSDVKDNIRLLVTFADNLDPPVVQACRDAQFPVPSNCDDILYNTFNSSVLYADNRSEDQNNTFNKLYWDMGQDNYKKFFTLLGGVKGCGLASTRQVIERRNALEPMISVMQNDLEDQLVIIENIERFVKKYNDYIRRGSATSSSNASYIEFEFTESILENITFANGATFWNCRVCRKTCNQLPFKSATTVYACNGLCRCNSLSHIVEPVEYRRRYSTIQTSLAKMVKYYEDLLGWETNVSILLDKCSAYAKRIKMEVLNVLSVACKDDRLSSSPDALFRSSKPFTVTDCLYMMSSRVAENKDDEKNLTRLDTFASLQKMLSDQEKKATSC